MKSPMAHLKLPGAAGRGALEAALVRDLFSAGLAKAKAFHLIAGLVALPALAQIRRHSFFCKR